MNYAIDFDSLHKHFPAGYAIPQLLLDFGSWLESRHFGSVGCFRLESERFNDFWIENGADLHPNFAFFMSDPTGGEIGYWLYDGLKTVSPPIVLVGSEGELKILGETLPDFLRRLAQGKTKAHDLDEADEKNDERGELTQWLDSHAAEPQATGIQERPDLQAWMKQWGTTQRAQIDNDPHHQLIADKLRKYLKPNAKPYETASFDVLLVGTQFKMWHRKFGPQPMPPADVADLEIAFRVIRDQRAEKVPERGRWFTSFVRISSKGGAGLCCNFMDEPKIHDEIPIISTDEFERDLLAFPRSEHWMPEWLKKQIR